MTHPATDAPVRNGIETQRRILDAATEVFAAKGFDGARMKAIALRAGVNPALLHHYFVDKETLHERVIERGLQALSARGLSVLQKKHSPQQAIERWIEVVTDLFHENRALIAIIHRESAAGGPRIKSLVRKTLAPVADAVVAYLRAGQADGAFRRDLEPRDLVISAMGMISHYFHEWQTIHALWPDETLSGEAVARRKREVTKLLLGGVLAV